MKVKTVYLALAIIGAVVPYGFFVSYWSTEGFGILHFAAAWFVNGAAGGAATDLFISSLVFWVYIFHRRRRGEGPFPWIFVLLNVFIGLSCALPAYFWAASKP